MNDRKEAEPFFTRPVIIEEKIDGSNLGISLSEDNQFIFQNRGKVIASTSATQWKSLDTWTTNHPELWELLEGGNTILFGEWCYAKHSLHYTRLPGYFVAFDLYLKKEKCFLSRSEFERRMEPTTIPLIRVIVRDVILPNKDAYKVLLDTPSAFHDGFVEGIYIRIDNEAENRNEKRAKLVRPDFMRGIDEGEHWAKQTLVRNTIAY